MLAALMSTIAGALNSTATLVGIDIIKKLRPDVSDRALVRSGQITAVVVMLLAMVWSTQGGRFESIFTGLNAMIACLAPPITAVFLWGVFWPRGTQQAALVTLVGGFVLGALVFTFDFPIVGLYEKTVVVDGVEQVVQAKLFTDIWSIPFMMQAWWLFVICSLIFLVMSLLTPPPGEEQIRDLCWHRPLAALTGERWVGMTDPRLLSAILIAVMAALYWTFV
jgi:SSS family solute:Na+ symporter